LMWVPSCLFASLLLEKVLPQKLPQKLLAAEAL